MLIIEFNFECMSNEVVKINWDNNFSIGIEEIDIHTQKIISITNQIGDAINSKDCEEEISSFMFVLIYFAHNNINQKENFLEQVNYPNILKLKEHHQTFIDKLIFFKNKLSDNQTDICRDLHLFLESWIHVCVKNNIKIKKFINQ